jgi:hypothetical protein
MEIAWCKGTKRNFDRLEFKHVKRKADQIADWLTNGAISFRKGVSIDINSDHVSEGKDWKEPVRDSLEKKCSMNTLFWTSQFP